MNKSIGIVGYGYVGKAFYNFFSDHYIMDVYDPFSSDPLCKASKDDINNVRSMGGYVPSLEKL